MPISRFDKPADSNVQQTYSPIPWDQMMKSGQIMAQQYETGMNALQKVYDDTYNIKYIPGSRDEQYVKQQVIPATKQIFEKYISQDMGNPIIRRQALSELNSKVDKNKIGKIQESWQGWAENQKWKQKLSAEGKFNQLLDTPDIGYDTDIHGVYNKITPAQLDARKKKEEYFDNLDDSSYVDKKTGQIVAFINDNQIKHLARAGYSDYMKSGEGKQDIQLYRMSSGDMETPDSVIAQDLLYKAGQEKKKRKIQGYVPEYVMKGINAEDEMFAGRPEAIPMVDVPGTSLKSDDFKTIPGGFAVNQDYQWWNPLSNAAETIDSEKGYRLNLLQKPEVKAIVNNLPDNYKQAYDSMLQGVATGEEKDLLFNKLQDVYKGLEENLKQGSYYRPFSVKGSKEQTQFLLGTDNVKELGSGVLNNRKIYSLKDKQPYISEDFLNGPVADILKNNKDAKVSVNGILTGNNPFSNPILGNDPSFRRGFIMSLGGNDYIVSGSVSSKDDIVADDTYQSMNMMRGTETPDDYGLTKIYDGNNYTFKQDGKVVASSPDFDEAYYTTLSYLRNKNKK